MRSLPLLLFCVFLISIFCGPSQDLSQTERVAIDTAKTWLALVDSARYTRSWEQASSIFRSAVSKSEWREKMRSLREPMGETVTRELKSAEFRTSLPGAPDGEYVVIQFRTSFQNKKSAVETITPMKETDGHWRVSGYYIR